MDVLVPVLTLVKFDAFYTQKYSMCTRGLNIVVVECTERIILELLHQI